MTAAIITLYLGICHRKQCIDTVTETMLRIQELPAYPCSGIYSSRPLKPLIKNFWLMTMIMTVKKQLKQSHRHMVSCKESTAAASSTSYAPSRNTSVPVKNQPKQTAFFSVLVFPYLSAVHHPLPHCPDFPFVPVPFFSA